MTGYDDHHSIRRGPPEPSRTEGPPCNVCGRPMLGRQKNRHHLCDPAGVVGHHCICTPGCTDTHIGDQGTCDAACIPCARTKGQLHRALYGKPDESKVAS